MKKPSFSTTSQSLLAALALSTIAPGCQKHSAPAVAPAAAPAPAPAAAASAAPAVPASAPAAAGAAPAAAPAAEEHHGMHHGMHRGGMAMLITESLAVVELRADQKPKVDAVVADLKKLGEAHHEEGRKLKADIADGVAAGKLDHAKIDADVKALAAAAEATKPKVQEAINHLHEALDPAQRKKLVQEMQAKGEMMRHHEEAEQDEHAEHAERHAEPAEHAEHGHGGHGPGQHMHEMAEMLGLTPEQRQKLETKMHDEMKAHRGAGKAKMEAMHVHMKTVVEAFEKDKFDAKQAGVGEHLADMAKDMASMRVSSVETLVALLTPEQRAKLAAHIREHAGEAD